MNVSAKKLKKFLIKQILNENHLLNWLQKTPNLLYKLLKIKHLMESYITHHYVIFSKNMLKCNKFCKTIDSFDGDLTWEGIEV